MGPAAGQHLLHCITFGFSARSAELHPWANVRVLGSFLAFPTAIPVGARNPNRIMNGAFFLGHYLKLTKGYGITTREEHRTGPHSKASRELCGVACASAQPAAAERRLMVWPSSSFWRLECTVACLVDRGRVSCQHKSCPESRENHHCTLPPGSPTNHLTSPQPCPDPVGYVTIMHTPSGPTVVAQRLFCWEISPSNSAK